MTSKLPENPKRRVPDWRITLPLAQASPRCGARYQDGHALQGTSDGLREVQDAWRGQHWPTHRRGAGAHSEGPDDAWAAHGGDGPDARDGAGSDGWREAARGTEMTGRSKTTGRVRRPLRHSHAEEASCSPARITSVVCLGVRPGFRPGSVLISSDAIQRPLVSPTLSPWAFPAHA